MEEWASPEQLASEAFRAGRVRALELQKKAKSALTSFTKSERFKKLCRKTFDEVDFDHSNCVDTKEVYCAVLLLYLKLVKIVNTAKPPGKHVIERLVHEVDINKSGFLNYEEFLLLATILCKNVAGRVGIEAAWKFIGGPLIAMATVHLVDYMYDAPEFIPNFLIQIFVSLRNPIVVSLVSALVIPALLERIDTAALTEADIVAEREALESNK